MNIYNISEIDKLLLKLEIEFSQKSKSRIIEEKKYQQIYRARDHIINYDHKINLNHNLDDWDC